MKQIFIPLLLSLSAFKACNAETGKATQKRVVYCDR